jgi:hypothetical protein
MVDLGSLGEDVTSVDALNDNGQVVGEQATPSPVGYSDVNNSGVDHAVLWSP